MVSVYEDQPDTQPPPIEVDWAPPPMLVEPPPPPPEPSYIWTGGYWGWHGRWVWIHGRWTAPPHNGYRWQQPYYEHRGGHVVFVGGFWARPGVEFVAPAAGVAIALAVPLPGIIAGPPPTGPEGVFIPPPPGSRPGLIVPAFVGCPPAVVMGAPPAIRPGMRVTHNHDTTANTPINNTTINNVTIIAPASAVATHVAVNSSVPAMAHLAAAQTPVVRMLAPQPATTRPVPAYSAAHSIALPEAQSVRAEVSPQLVHLGSAAHESARPGELSRPGTAAPMASQDHAAPQRQIDQQRAAQMKAAQERATQQRAEQEQAVQAEADQQKAVAERAAQEAQARRAAEAAAEASQKEAAEANQKAAAANAERSRQQAAAEAQSKEEATSVAERNRQQAAAGAEQKAAEEAASRKKAAEEAAAKKAAEKNHPPQ